MRMLSTLATVLVLVCLIFAAAYRLELWRLQREALECQSQLARWGCCPAGGKYVCEQGQWRCLYHQRRPRFAYLWPRECYNVSDLE